MYWDREYETMSREQLRILQLERLKLTIERVYRNVPFYRHRFIEAGIKPSSIRTLEDLRRLPFTTKQDLRDNYPFGLFAVPMSDVVRVHASSGTTGKPTVVGYTQNDINTWAELIARSLTCAGATRFDVVQNAYGYGLFTGGLGLHFGVERLGATVVPVSGGNTRRQLMLMQDFGTTILTCTPSYALYMAEEGQKMGLDFKKLPLKAGVFGAEPWSERMRQQLEEKLDLMALDIYGLSEIMGPGVAMECAAKQGMHIWEDHFIPEIIDPATGEVLPPGEQGELVITTITKEAFPLIRYRTRDITRIDPEPCSCGRTHVRIKRITGRSDDMLIIRGVNVFPSQVESVLLEFGETEPHYLLVVDRKENLDSLEIWVEVAEHMFSDTVRKLEDLEYRLRERIESVLGISARVKLVEPNTIPRSEGKAKRVVDRRQI
ncbi:phenylacetate--CoA ligase family protein [Desulfofundulus thermocisternus]|uniref:phenylacetate--CoA ligase family protein n=1 Tax=Desulfofundulus thermocisternus TaxID=42471 RepID=UPI001A0CA5D2|nr:phenylacetate--CoA ligase [Desulfofundulus thermocisternus]MBE3585322.1 phenylacetate--CoA ligase [Thermoanaerobacter sp.]MCS5695121.1 phenylacetate--CoA ligase [Desulfofundulus thermocisternus]